ncbi:MAG: TonB-dependent receptor [Chitinivibrionales bacterium]|nr:TonB-dependent receptor [Chitinivibrionales bacterium]
MKTTPCILLALALNNLTPAEQAAVDSTQETGDSGIVSMDRIIVTATRTQKKQEDLSSSVSIVDSDDIEALNPASSTDILGSLPGITIHKTGSFGRADVAIRGIGDKGRRMMVLVDGRPEKMGLFGCSITHSLPANNVERIEVVRGPSSVLYGSDALGGVVNIITKKAEKKIEGDAMVSYGTENTQRYRGRIGGLIKGFDYYVTADRQSSDGHLQNSSYEANDFSARAGYSIQDKFSITLTGKLFDGYKEEPAPAAYDTSLMLWKSTHSPADSTWNNYLRGFVDATIDWKPPWLNLMAKYYRDMGEHEFDDGYHSRDHTDGVIIHGSRRVLQFDRFSNTLVAGLEFRRQAGELLHEPFSYERDTREFSKYELGVFASEEQELFDVVILNGGIRYNYDESYGSTVVPQGGIVGKINERLHVRGLVSRGFRSPQINELYMMKSSNEELEPEKNINYEAGIHYGTAAALELDIAGFYTEGENMIATVPTGGMPPFRFENTGEYTMRGLEFRSEIRPVESTTFGLSYSWLDPYELPKGIPQNMLNVSLRYENEYLLSMVGGHYMLNYYADDAMESRIDGRNGIFTVYGRFRYKITKGLRLFAHVNNALNRNYALYADLPSSDAGVYLMSGIEVSGGLAYHF